MPQPDGSELGGSARQPAGSARVVRLDDAPSVAVAGGRYTPLRRLLGVRAFGINAYSALHAGEQLIEPHDELGAGSGHHEEAYIVVSGRARFTIGEQEIDATPATIVFVPDVSARRSATALQDGTVAIVVGAPAERPLPTSPFDYWFRAEEPYRRGDYRAAIEIASEGLAEWPEHSTLNYQLACYHARAGTVDQALEHLRRAVAADAATREWADGDRDFDAIRGDPRFQALVRQVAG